MADQMDLFGQKPTKEPEPEHDWLDSSPSTEVLASQPLPTWAEEDFATTGAPAVPQVPKKKFIPKIGQRKVGDTECSLCGVSDCAAKPFVPWMGGLVHAGCHWEYMERKHGNGPA